MLTKLKKELNDNLAQGIKAIDSDSLVAKLEGNSNTIKNYLSKLTHLGYLRRLSKATYLIKKEIPSNLIFTNLYERH